ncbi:hypothetical protein EXW72_07205 [Pseudomonas sp. BCA14]|uniref:hypothetical protein n=1 Tax=unclassified Pseudomonas TaxID=196821 RepID=UPI00106EDE00|nr:MULTISPECIES: hypothetical protein [unclassified Pseudomonas]TFF13937.1 hypothetical protein EXW70_05285 [Pseudomonas sp. JMN1]TFF15380.1 hypothetical protein EXW71_03755 [Pseudomonas sp. BCA17]TFF31787.1 hypothetical protein EXW72_07205 [Pseudomonas sp. BCA14]TFF32739.1 hypothetical protein EXW73_03005 [Pseudomonas sp. BCA13]
MRFKKKSLVAVVSCAMMFAAAPLLPAGLSVVASAYAKDGGGHGGGGNGGGGGGHAGAGHSAGSAGKGLAEGHEIDHDAKGVRDHGVSGNHVGRGLKNDQGHGLATSGVAHAKTTQGLSKATAISATTPGDHNAKGLSKAGISTSH